MEVMPGLEENLDQAVVIEKKAKKKVTWRWRGVEKLENNRMLWARYQPLMSKSAGAYLGRDDEMVPNATHGVSAPACKRNNCRLINK
jgi:hypothetical protein